MKQQQSRSHLRRVRASISGGVIVVVAGVALAACSGSTGSQGAVDNSNNTAQIEYNEFTSSVQYPYTTCDSLGANCKPNPPANPLERENLAKRLIQYNSKGDTNYVYVFAWGSPTPIGYYVISGKVSSTGSQMTSTQQVTDCGNQGSCAVTDAIGDDGSYGPEEGGANGVFFFTSTGTLVETDQPWVESSAPIKLYASVSQLDTSAK